MSTRLIRAVRYLGPAPAARGPAWRLIGQDGGQSIALGARRTLFLFADTLLQPANSGRQVILPNCAAIGTGATLPEALSELCYFADRRGRPRAILEATAEERHGRLRLWPAHGVRVGARVLLFYLGIHFVNPASPWGFRNLGAGLAELDLDTGSCRRLRGDDGGWCLWPARGDDLHFGVQALRDGGDDGAEASGDDRLYVFLSSRKGLHSHAGVARVALAEATDPGAYRFLDAGGGWRPRYAERADLGVASNDFSVSWNRHLGRYLMTYVDVYAKTLHLRLADRPEGPYEAPHDLGRLPHSARSELIYLAFEHPALARDGGRTVFVSYSQPHFALNGLVAVTFV